MRWRLRYSGIRGLILSLFFYILLVFNLHLEYKATLKTHSIHENKKYLVDI